MLARIALGSVALGLVGCRTTIDTSAADRTVVAQLRTSHLDALRPFEHLNPLTQDGADILAGGWRYHAQPRIAMTPPIDWQTPPKVMRSWGFDLQAWHPVASLAAAYADTGEHRFLDAALAVALDWLRAAPPPSSRTDRGLNDPAMFWYDMAVGLRTYILAYLLDVARRDATVDDDTLAALWSGLRKHLFFLANDDNVAFESNHAFFQVAGQLAAATRFAWLPQVEPAQRQAHARLDRVIDQQFASDGLHAEHSPGYHRMVLSDWWTLVDAGLASAPDLAHKTRALEDALAWLIKPNGFLAMLGDTSYRDATKVLDQRAFVSPALQYLASDGARGTAPASEVATFPVGGLVAMRRWPAPGAAGAGDDASYLAMQCAFHSRVHKHADDLAIVWFDRGRDILIGPGIFGYGAKTTPGDALATQGFWYADPRRVYVESTAAHSTVELDGRSQDRLRPPYGAGVVYGGVQGDVRLAGCRAPQGGGVTLQRWVATVFGKWLLVLDEVRDPAGAAHAARQWFHLAPDLTAELTGETLAVAGVDAPLRVVSLLSGPRWASPVRGQDAPLQGWWSPRTGVLEPATAAALAAPRGTTATFATLLAFGATVTPDHAHSTVDAHRATLRWTADGQPVTLVIDGLDGATPTVSVGP